MVQNPPEGNQRIIPYLNYRDPRAAIDFICQTFGFEVAMVMDGPDGSVAHAELRRDNETLMLAGEFEPLGLKSPQSLGGCHATVMLYVDDVDAHYAAAKATGAEIIEELTDQFYGDRTYRVRDPEGVGWDIHQHIRDVSPEEMAEAAMAMAAERGEEAPAG